MKNKRVLICGSRDYYNREVICYWLCKLQDWGYDTIIEGEARGADTIAREEGEKLGFIIMESAPGIRGFPANWAKYGKAAGPIRNKQMLVEGKPSLVIAFSDDFQNSKGTRNMVEQAQKIGITTIVVE